MNWKEKTWFLGVFLGIFLYGFSDSLRGSTLPDLLDSLDLDYKEAGFILTGSPLGFLITSFVSGLLLPKLGYRPLYISSSVLITLGYFAFINSSTPFHLWVSTFIAGLGMGALQLLSNSTLIRAYPKHKARLLSYGAIVFSFGITAAPPWSNLLFTQGYHWQGIFAGIIFLALLLTFITSLPTPRQLTAKKKTIQLSKGLFKSQNVLIFLLLFLCYSTIEVGFASWLVEFLQRNKNAPSVESQNLLTFYFVAIIIGRLLGAAFLDKVSLRKLLLINTFTFSIACLLFIHSQNVWIWLLLCGLSLSLFFPACTALASDLFGDKTETVLGFAFSIAGAGAAFGLYSIGTFGDKWGLERSIHIIPALSFFMFLSLLFLKKKPL